MRALKPPRKRERSRSCVPDTMYHSYIMRRTQIYLSGSQRERIARRAGAAGLTGSKVIREAVEAYLAGPVDDDMELVRQRQAIVDAFGISPRLPRGADFVDEARTLDAKRTDELEARWRSP